MSQFAWLLFSDTVWARFGHFHLPSLLPASALLLVLSLFFRMCVCARTCVCVCVCERERESACVSWPTQLKKNQLRALVGLSVAGQTLTKVAVKLCKWFFLSFSLSFSMTLSAGYLVLFL